MNASVVLDRRRAGILLHPTSLPGANDHGDMGHQAYRFVEFLQAAGISVWQTLPLGPTHEDRSPYQCLSVHAGNPLLVSMDWLLDRGWLKKSDMRNKKLTDKKRRQYLSQSYKRFLKAKDDYYQPYLQFLQQQAYWLDDYALFIAIRNEQQHNGWMFWPAPLRERDGQALTDARERLHDEIKRICFEQFVFFQQWLELKQYAKRHGIIMFGDMPIFVAHDSAEVWAHREFFSVNEHGEAIKVAGVPPDYFSENGQRWGNPLYQWDNIKADNFKWWIDRMRTQLLMFDIVRIDHFRGFEANWEIPAEEPTAINGHWVKTPGRALLKTLHKHFDPLPIIAEDLGIITPEVDALRQEFHIPGMKVLQFAFSDDNSNPYLPHNHSADSVVYTGTHDNDTTLSWYNDLDDSSRQYTHDYLGDDIEDMPWPMIRLALASVSGICILPMQDILSLGKGNRMNVPGTQEGNWCWRFEWDQVAIDLGERLNKLIKTYERN